MCDVVWASYQLPFASLNAKVSYIAFPLIPWVHPVWNESPRVMFSPWCDHASLRSCFPISARLYILYGAVHSFSSSSSSYFTRDHAIAILLPGWAILP